MVEILAAVTGASISVAAMTWTGSMKRNTEGREAVIRLTAAVEHVAGRLEALHVDFKSDRHEIFGRLNGIEQRLAKFEATNS